MDKKASGTNNKFNKVAEYKINTQRKVLFLYTSNEYIEKKLKIFIYDSILKIKILKNKFDQGGKGFVD